VKHLRPALFLLAVALFSASAWAQDPKPIPQKGTDATLITLDTPNPTVTMTAAPNSPANPCPFESAFCVDDNFQNLTGQTITSITMLFKSQSFNHMTLVFNCPNKLEMLSAVFFDNCSQSAGPNGAEDVTFSADGKNGFNGVASAGSTVCIPDLDDLFGLLGCDKDDVTKADGLFAIDMYGSGVTCTQTGQCTSIETQAITAPEPAAGLMVLFSALAFALFKLVRRPV
jgi:hypothetical protein